MSKREPQGGPPPKLCLPFGWKVITSKTYPDRVYYFNTRTNVSAWDPPTLVTEKEYLASIPPDELAAKKAAAQKQQKQQVKPQIQAPALRDRRNPVDSPVRANQIQYTAKTPTKSGKDFIRADQSTGSSGFVDDPVFSPVSLQTDTDNQFQSDNENDLELRPELSDLQKQILENEEIETQFENKKQNLGMSQADKYREDTSPMTFSVSDSLRTLKGSASKLYKSKAIKMNPEKPKTMTFSLADNLKMIRSENQEEESNKYSDHETMTFSVADNLKSLREMECKSKKSSKKLEINEHKNTVEKSEMTFSLASILNNIRENEELAEAIPDQTNTPSKEQCIRPLVETSRIVVTRTVPSSDPSNSLPQSFGKKDRPFSSRYNNKQKPKCQKKNLTTTVNRSNTSPLELFTRKRRLEILTGDGAGKKLRISSDKTGDRKIFCANEKPGLATNDLRFKLKQKQGMCSVANDEDQVEETVELPAPKKHEIQSWINSIAEADPVPSVCDFPQSPISKTSSKSDGSSVSSKDRRVVLSTECNNNNVPYDSGYSTSTGLTIGAAVALSQTKETEVNENGGEEEGMEIDDDDDINEEEVEMMIVDLQEVREEIKTFPDQLDEGINDDITPIKDFTNKNLHLIIDTNILVQSLKFLQNILETVLDGFGLPYIVIPWIVMQELDYIKDGKSRHNVNQFTKDKAFKAVKFLFSCLQSGHPRVRGQTSADLQQTVEGLHIDCNDDRVLQCYLRHQLKYPNACVVLLTDDINLCNKASINHIQAFTKNTVFSGLKNLVKHHSNLSYKKNIPQASMLQSSPSPSQSSFKPEHPVITTPAGISQYDRRKLIDETLCQVKEEIKTGLSVVLETEMKDAFNNIWKSVIYRKPPWSALDIMECFQKHWMAVFGMILPRKKEYLVKDIVNIVKNPEMNMSVEDVKKLIEMVTDFMTVCETRQSYNGILRTCKRNLDNLLSQCSPVKQSKSIRFHSPRSSTLAVDDFSEIESMTDEEDLLTSLQDRFQLIWSTINDFCNHLPQLDDPAFNLSLIIPVITELKQLFSYCLTISPQDVHLNRGKFESFTHCLNAFFSRINLESPRPLTTQAVVCYFANPSKREILEGGLLQLDRMILKIHNYVQTL